MIDLDLKTVFERLVQQFESHGFKGYDPYDALASRFVPDGRLGRRFALALTHLNKTSPVNLRPLLGIEERHNAKAAALIARSIITYDARKHAALLDRLIRWLLENRSKAFEEYSIGFTFPLTMKHYSEKQNSPSLVITLFVMYAFIDFYNLTHDSQVLGAIRSFSRLIDRELPKREDKERLWYSYTFEGFHETYNATAKIGKYYALVYDIDRQPDLVSRMQKIAAYLMSKQRDDGSWPYAETIAYSDGFHTAFILDAIWRMKSVLNDPALESTFQRGMENYVKSFIRDNGQPVYYHPKYMPKDYRRLLTVTDIRDCAMAVILFTKLGWRERAERVLSWTLRCMYNTDSGHFYFYKERYWTNKVQFIRPQAWMMYALAGFMKSLDHLARNTRDSHISRKA